ncbi:hypothetical protein HW115_02720 [Verrucomicrobiaceae bacterium N1E253]|uniref:Uncharacterized protein n=1 Tax=Oceaniferula marina TaxID=2748318 RepID=A0A851G9V6_9BACT|nr:hypothetical protein [Oceaniferula marina]NWK54508.1 hypothetical protein [Oceaniferula marina]
MRTFWLVNQRGIDKNFEMKNIIAILCGFACMTGVVFSANPEVESQIKRIKKWYQQIESDKSLKKQVIEAKSELPYEPKMIRYTRADGELKKLQIELLSDHGFTHETYYFHEGELFFIYAVDEYWQFVPSENGEVDPERPETLDVGSQQRYYFSKGKCIRALEKQAETREGEKLRQLLKEAENKPLDVDLGAAEYVQKAKLVSEIKTLKELNAFLEQFTK